MTSRNPHTAKGSPADRRAYPRHPLHQNALVTAEGMRPRGYRIRDFCWGGMFLAGEHQHSESIATKEHAIARGQVVDIQFSVHIEAVRKSFRLQARVARVFEGGMGVAFIAPDPNVLRVLKNLATKGQSVNSQEAQNQSVGEQPRSTPKTLGAIDRRRIMASCKKVVAQHLPSLFRALFHQVEERLVVLARDATNNAAQTRYFDGIAELKALREPTESAFCGTILDEIDHLQKPRAETERCEEAPLPKLSLMEKEDFEDWLTVAEAISKTESRYRKQLFEIEQQFAYLIQRPIDKENNPVWPAAICHAFRDAVQNLPVNHWLKQLIYQVFQDLVGVRLGELYEHLSRVLPVLERESSPLPRPTSREKARHSQNRQSAAAMRQRSARAARVSGLPGAVIQEAYAAARVLSGLREGDRDGEVRWDQEPRFPTGRAGLWPGRARRYDTGEILEVLSALQSEAPSSLVEGPPGFDLKTRVLAALTRRNGDGEKQMDYEQNNAVDVIENLFGSILEDPTVADGIKPWIRGLEIPLLKTAILDEAFLRAKSHPARQVLNQLDRLGVAIGEDGGLTDQDVRPTIDHLMGRIVNEFDQDTGIFSEVIKELDALEESQNRLFRRNVERAISACEGTYRVEKAKRAVFEELDRRIGGKRVPEIIPALLDAGWHALLVLAYIRHGHESREWLEYLDIIDQLLLRLDDNDTEHQNLSLDVPALLGLIDQGLGSVSGDPFQSTKILDELRALLKNDREGRTPPAMVVVRRDTIDPQLGRGDATLMAPEEVSEQAWAQWINRAKRLQEGDWLVFPDGSQGQQPLKLIWIGEGNASYVFVNRKGIRVADLSLQELALRLGHGTAKILEESNLSLVERASHKMLEKMQDQLVYQATHDPLTGLLSRKEFERQLENLLAHAKQEHSHHVLCVLGMDRFKIINNTCGHVAGDVLLKDVGELLQEHMGKNGTLARLGGDEFGVLLENCSQEEGYRIADRQRRAIQAYRFVWEDKRLSPGVSIGLVAIAEQSESVKSLLKAADSACFVAKDAGRNRIQVYHADKPELIRHRDVMEWAAGIDKALDEDRLHLRCQRITPIDQDASLDAHYEILLGVGDKEGKPIPPAEFIQAAELYNRMPSVDRWVISNAFRWMADHREFMNQFGGFAINLSGQSFNDEHFLGFVLEQFSQTQVPPEKVSFEITETAAVGSLTNTSDFMREIKRIGCQFSLDDFGSGLSSYSYLKSLPVDYLKIDGMFVKDIVTNPNDYAVVKSINEIGHFMGKQTIAEYVENDAILERLREIGVDFAQGYGIEKPRFLEDLP